MSEITVGARVELARDVERYPHFIATAGARGTVVDTSCGNLCVRMDDQISGAEPWDNEVVWSRDHGSDREISDDLRLIEEG